jgi:hypothetical protein
LNGVLFLLFPSEENALCFEGKEEKNKNKKTVDREFRRQKKKQGRVRTESQLTIDVCAVRSLPRDHEPSVSFIVWFVVVFCDVLLSTG